MKGRSVNLFIFKLRFHLDNLTSSPVKTRTLAMKPQQWRFQQSSSHAGAGQATLRAQTLGEARAAESDTDAAFPAREGGGETPPWHSMRLRHPALLGPSPAYCRKPQKCAVLAGGTSQSIPPRPRLVGSPQHFPGIAATEK